MTALEPIADGDHLLRRVPSNPDLWAADDDGVIRVSSVAFKPSSSDDGVSVIARRLLDDPKDPEVVLSGRPTYGLIEFTAQRPRDLGLDVVHAPLPDTYAHANIVGFPPEKAARKRLQRELARDGYVWICHPEGGRSS